MHYSVRRYLLPVTLLGSLAFMSVPALAKTDLWVYTSIYKEFAAPIEAAFEKKYPDIDVNVFQAGSEKIQAKLEAEVIAKKLQADVVATSDPFWSQDLVKRGLVFTDKTHPAVQTNYYSLMVMIAHKAVPAAARPKSFSDLVKPEFKDKVQMGSPLESGTTFSTVAYLSRKYEWSFFEKLRANGVVSSGGNSTVIQKVESGEKKLGVVLLENALAAQKRGSPVEIIYPEDGAVTIPSVQVILKDSAHVDAAKKFCDFLLSDEGQKLLVGGFMYSINPKIETEGAKPLAEVTAKSTPWSDASVADVATGSKDIKKKFASIVLE